MTKISRLTKESEERISEALSEVASRTNDGESPNDAIVKVATARQIPAGQVRLMVRAFNNGRCLSHLRNHDTIVEKAAAFALADASEILERMFPSEVETPAQKAAAAAVSTDYAMSPAGWLHRRAQASRRTALLKTASARTDAAPEALAYEEMPTRMGKQAVSALHDLRREHQRMKDDAIGACYKVAATVNDVGEYFRRPTRRPVAEVMLNARAAFGKPGANLVKHAADMVKAKTAVNVPLTHKFSWNDEPYSLIKAALDAMTDFTAKRTALETFEDGLVEKRAEILRPFVLAPEQDVIIGSVWDNQSRTKQAAGLFSLGIAGFMGGSARGLAEKIAPKSTEQMVQEEMNRLATPEHEDKLRAIRLQTMIHEMMASDPVISGYDPEEVMDAYNHLSEVAPRAMQQRVMAQALIRRYLEQASAIDPFDVDQLLGVESKLIDRDMPAQLMTHQLPGQSRELGPMISKPRGLSQNAPEAPTNPVDLAFERSHQAFPGSK